MIKLFIFLGLILALGLGFGWLADRPGDLVLTFSGMRYELTLTTAVAAMVAIIVAVMVTWWLLRSIWESPRMFNRYFRARKRDRGYQAISTGLLAAGSGDASAARLMAERASGFLSSDQEPLIPYLKAQAALLEGKHEEARAIFTDMVEHGETKALGLHGLYLEAKRLGEPVAAYAYAEEAVSVSPQLDWAADAALSARVAEGDWEKALDLVEKRRQNKQLSKEAAKRQRAVILSAKSINLALADPNQAKSAGLEAVRLAPDFIPASLAAAESLVRLTDIRKATKVLETIWKAGPHPEVAYAYTHLRHGDSAIDRLTRAKRLEKIKPNNPQGLLILAEAEMEAGHYTEARKSIEAVLRQSPTERAWLLLADIEERETGNQGRVRQWLQSAVRAPRDPAWTANGVISERWAPVSPVTGRLDAFEWKVPVSRMATTIEGNAEGQSDNTNVPEDMLALVLDVPAAKPEVKTEPVVEAAKPAKPETIVAKPETVKTATVVTKPEAPAKQEQETKLEPKTVQIDDEPAQTDADKKTDIQPVKEPSAEEKLRLAGGTPDKDETKPKSGFRLF